MNEHTLNLRLKQLRAEWAQKPHKRSIILRQLIALEKATGRKLIDQEKLRKGLV